MDFGVSTRERKAGSKEIEIMDLLSEKDELFHRMRQINIRLKQLKK